MEKNLFMTLYNINVNDKVEEKNGLSYVSWPFAWAEVKKIVPDARYTIYERDTEFGPVNYFTDGKTCWVKTGVTLDGLEHIEELPVMDFKNRSILLDNITSMDVNKAIQRSLTKACARHGLGLYIYAGEDLPECEADAKPKENVNTPQTPEERRSEIAKATKDVKTCERCGKPIRGGQLADKSIIKAEQVLEQGLKDFKMALCYHCQQDMKAKKEGAA